MSGDNSKDTTPIEQTESVNEEVKTETPSINKKPHISLGSIRTAKLENEVKEENTKKNLKEHEEREEEIKDTLKEYSEEELAKIASVKEIKEKINLEVEEETRKKLNIDDHNENDS
jgi:hypothetical protein